MMKNIIFGASVILILCGVSFAGGLAPYKQGELLVRFDNAGFGLNSTDPAEQQAARESVLCAAGGGTIIKSYESLPGWSCVKLPSGMSVESAIAQYASAPGIMFVEPNYKYELFRVPNDSLFSQQWALRNTGQAGGIPGDDIGAESAWDIQTGSINIIVAVTDTGIDYMHPDLAGNMWVNEAELNGEADVDDDGNGYVDDVYGYDFAGDEGANPDDGDPDPDDFLYHGTHVAGIIGAVGNNSRGVSGVCWDVRLMALKIFADDGDGAYTDDEVQAILYAVDNGAKVINASWGGYGESQALRDAIIYAQNAGVLFVAAAGNDYSDNDQTPVYPASYTLNNIISVMATDNTDSQASYSNWGATSVDIAAPGGENAYGIPAQEIISTFPGGTYDSISGTSMAAPHVAGACALLLSYDSSLTYSEVKNQLINTVDKIDGFDDLCVSGGRLNIGDAIMDLEMDIYPPSPDPAQWASWGQPKATGPHAIAMEAVKAVDKGIVRYYFQCMEDSSFDSDWQSGTLYSASGLDEATQYTFRVQARDDSGNYTGWSVERSATTGTSPDTLTPFPDPAQWKTTPIVIRVSPLSIRMEARTASDESGVQYKFSAYSDAGLNNEIAYRDWNINPVWSISSGPFTQGNTYYFRFAVRDGANNTTGFSTVKSVLLAEANEPLLVPSRYTHIQDAIDAANVGDVVIVSTGTYEHPRDVNLIMKPGITVRSFDPNNPDIVAVTVIDCNYTVRGVNFTNENGIIGNDTVFAGFTIINGRAVGAEGTPGSPEVVDTNDPDIVITEETPAGEGQPGMGGGIYIADSNPTIVNCVLNNCAAIGGDGGDPNGAPEGGVAGDGLGGGIYIDGTSDPMLLGIEVRFCSVTGGFSTFSEQTGSAFALGGGIYIEDGGEPVIEDCDIMGCNASNFNRNTAAGGGLYYGDSSSRVITNTMFSYNTVFGDGGGVYFEDNGSGALSNCEFLSNLVGGPNVPGSGGAIYFGKGQTLSINNCRIRNNSANYRGGGIFAGELGTANSVSVNIVNSLVNQNSARFGGGIYTDDAILQISGSQVNGNSAEEGAGLNCASGIIDFTNSSFSENAAYDPGVGGGMSMSKVEGSIINCNIQDNSSTGTAGMGGGAYFNGYDRTPKIILNCLVTGNTAQNEGAGLFFHLGAWAQIENCTIAENTVPGNRYGIGGGILCAENVAYVQMKNSIVYDNNAAYGPEISAGRLGGSLDRRAFVDVSFSDVQGIWDGVFEDQPYSSIYFGDDIYDELDPFVLTGSDVSYFYLRNEQTGQVETSELVDAGDGSASDFFIQAGTNQLTTRIDGTPDSGTVDIGYHYPADFNAGGIDIEYQLTIRVETVNGYPADGVIRAEGFGFDPVVADEQPQTVMVRGGVQVELAAIADAGFEVLQWTGADYVPNTGDPCNVVTMNADKQVTVAFGPQGAFYLYTEVTTNNGRIDYINDVSQRVEHPGRTLHDEGEVVELIAVPNNVVLVPRWTNTDDDSTISTENTVTMNTSKFVTVSFAEPTVYYVGQGSSPQMIQNYINLAQPGDIVMIAPGTWDIYEGLYGQDHLILNGKDITITSENPQEPNNTIILGRFELLNVTNNTVIQGFTITGNYRYADRVMPDDPPAGMDGLSGLPEHGGGMLLHDFYQVSEGHFVKYGSGSPTVRNCVFLNCSAIGRNGLDGEPGEENPDGSYSSNGGNGGWGSWAHGGAVSCGPDSNPIFENCTFQGNFARGGDGGNGANGGDGFVPGYGGNWGDNIIPDPYRGTDPWDDGPFLPYWRYSGYGGAVYIDSNCSARFIDCNFIDNYVQGPSSGISGTGANGVFYAGWPYDHYVIDCYGGAVYAAANSVPVFTDCNFVSNIGDNNGIPTHRDGGTTTVAYPDLSYGGAIAFEDGANVTLEGCTFLDNTADVGGGVYFARSNPQIIDCNMFDNIANHGGGILCVGGSGTIDGCRITGNNAASAGGIGGGIASLGANTKIRNCEVLANNAQSSGGGIYISSKGIDGNDVDEQGWNMVTVSNCLVTENTAGSSGAGVSANWYAYTDLEFCTIVNNSVLQNGYGGGLYSSYGNYIMVNDSIIWGNAAANGRQIAVRPKNPRAGVFVDYSNIRGGNTYTQPPATGGNVWVDTDCIYDYGQGNIGADLDDNPLFVQGILGNYYLSHSDIDGQNEDSPCIDIGSDSASSYGMNLRTTRTDEVFDHGVVDMGFHYPLSNPTSQCKFCDIVRDGVIDWFDNEAFSEQWLSDGCSQNNGWCQGADFNFDGQVDFADYAIFGLCWFQRDDQAPMPDPMEWRILPYLSSSRAVSMGAAKAYDNWGGKVQYYFECSDSAFDSGWQFDEPNYIATGLLSGTQYSFRVKARDEWGTLAANETQWSVPITVVIAEDTTKPLPNPMTWALLPTAVSDTNIIMTATVATDDSGVEYGFQNVTTGTLVWQDDPTYMQNGLQPSTTYTYKVAARDKSENHNTTTWSVEASATTTAEPTPPDLQPPVTGVYTNIYKAAFAVVPDETFVSGVGWVQTMTAVAAADATPPVQYKFYCYDEPGLSSGWLGVPTYQVTVSPPSMQSKDYLKWQVRTRDSVVPNPNYGDFSDYYNCRDQSYPYP